MSFLNNPGRVGLLSSTLVRAPAVSDSDAQAWIDVMSVAPNSTYRSAYNSFVLNLKTGLTHGTDIWSDLDEIWFHKGHDSQASSLGIKGQVAATLVNSPVHNAGLGFDADGSSAYIDFGGAVDSFGSGYTLNSASMTAYFDSLPATDGNTWFLLGASNGTNPGTGSAGFYWFRNSISGDVHAAGGTTFGTSTSSGAAGLWVMNRESSTLTQIFRDGVLVEGDGGTASTNIPTQNLYGLARNLLGSPSNYAPATVRLGVTALGAPLSANQQVDLKAAIDAFSTSVSAVDPDAQAWIDAMSVAPNSAYESAYDTFIKELKTGPTNGTNVWTKLDVLHVLAAHDSQAALLNAKDPTGTAATAVNTPTFNAGQGFTFDGSTNYINTNWYAAKPGNNFVQNSGHFGLYHRSIGTAASLRTSGAYPSGSNLFFQMNTSNNVAASINTKALLSDTGNTAGWTLMNRTAFNDGRLYYGATQAQTYNTNTSALSSAAGKEFFIGALHLTGGASQHGDVEVSVFTAGAGLTANEITDLNAAIDNLKTTIGF